MAEPAARDLDILRALLRVAENALPHLPPYLVSYLSDHARAAGPQGWRLLAEHPGVLARLDSRAVAADAIRTPFGTQPMPDAVAGILLARARLATAAHGDRIGLGQLARARAGGEPEGGFAESGPHAGEPGPDWTVRRALLRSESPGIELRGSTEGVRSVTAYLDPSGSPRLAVGDTVGRVRIWDPVTGTVLSELTGHRESVRASLVLDGSLLVTGGQDGTVRLWDLARRRELDGVEAGGPVWALHDLRDGRFLSGAHDGSVRRWHIASSGPAPSRPVEPRRQEAARLVELGALPLPDDAEGPGSPGGVDALTVVDSDLAPTEGLVVVGRTGGRVEWWHPWAFDGVRPEPMAEHTRPESGVRALTTIGGRVIVGYSDATVRSWALGEPEPRDFGPRGLDPRTLCTWPSGDLVVAGNGHDVSVLDAADGSERARLRGHSGEVRCSSVFTGTGDGLVLATGAEDGSVRCWTGWSDRAGRPEAAAIRALTVAGDLTDPPLLVAGGVGATMLAFRGGPDARPQSWGYHSQDIVALDWLRGPAGRVILVSAGGTAVEFNELTAGGVQPSERGHARPVSALAVVAGRTRAVSADRAGLLVEWGLDRVEPGAVPRGRPTRSRSLGTEIRALCAVPDGAGEYLLAATRDGEFHPVSASDLAPLDRGWHLDGPPAAVTALSSHVSSAGTARILVARTPQRRHDPGGSRPEPVERRSETLLIDPADGSVTELLAHAGVVRASTTISDEAGRRVLVTGDGDGRIAFSDPDTGVLRHTIETGLPVLALAGYAGGLAVGTSGGIAVLQISRLTEWAI